MKRYIITEDEKKRIEERINTEHQLRQQRRFRKGKSKEGYQSCRCGRRFSVLASRVNGHEGYCSKKCKFGKGKRRIRDLEKHLTPEVRRTNRQVRRQQKIITPPSFYESDAWRTLRFKVLREFKYTCLACGRKPPDVEIHVDHIKPRSKYPELELDQNNLQLLCKDCNLGKSNRYEDDLRPPEDFLTDAAKIGIK